MKKLILLASLVMFFASCKDKYASLKDGLYAEIKTVKGDIIVQLEFEKTPVTVANFVSLAEGKNTFVSENLKGKKLYNGLKFHRVIANFMIQGGDPLGNGSGDTGYKFKDEITDLKFDNGGLLAMANSGPGTNSSQFFITHVETPWLNGLHTIFGHVVENGMEVVNKIEQDNAIISVNIIRRGEKAKRFDAVKIFANYFASESENLKNQSKIQKDAEATYVAKYKTVIDGKSAEIKDLLASGIKTTSGVVYKILKKGNGAQPKAGADIQIYYAGYFENGVLFDTNVQTVADKFGKLDQARASQNGYQPLPFQAGRKEGMIPGFLEGLTLLKFGDKALIYIPSNLGYGPAGAGNGVIPPDSNLIFEIEILK